MSSRCMAISERRFSSKRGFLPIMVSVFVFLSAIFCTTAVERVYYIGIVEEIWDYAPTGLNLISGVPLADDADASVYYKKAPDRIGRKYKKALYYQYEDQSFTKRVPKDPKLGFLGPTITGEVGDVIMIHVKNFATRDFSLHTHGVQYLKKSEGAFYVDGRLDVDKLIKPQETKTYTWNMHAQYGPTDYDPDCSTFIYHSHVDAMKDTYSGLIGTMLVCRKGSLRQDGSRRDVDRSYVLNFYVIDENLSWYIDENINISCTTAVDKDDPDFQESNTMHAINGLGYGNLQGLTACEGEKIGWNLFGFGNEADIHSVQFEKQSVIVSTHRQDTVNLFAASFKSVTMVADNPGFSMIYCRVDDHYTAGMYTSLNVSSNCGSSVADGNWNPVKSIFIAIEEKDWNYGPSGMNLMTGKSLTENGTHSRTYFLQGNTTIGGTYKKALFIGYDDSNFTKPSTKINATGLLGPLIAVETGDIIHVTLWNNATYPYNVEPHGLHFTDTTQVLPGESHTFIWLYGFQVIPTATVRLQFPSSIRTTAAHYCKFLTYKNAKEFKTAPDSMSPTDLDPDCIAYLYTSTVDPVKDAHSGLVGPLLLCKRGTLESALSRDAYYLLFSVLNENQSHYMQDNIDSFTTSPSHVDPDDEDFKESNMMHSINGLMYGNLQDLTLCVGRETDFHVIGLGTEIDMHSMFASGLNIRVRNANTQVMSVFPHTTATTTVVPSSVGSGEIKCIIPDNLLGGMLTSYSVSQNCGSAKPQVTRGISRHYYVGVVEENWDYASGEKLDSFGHSFSNPQTPGYTYVHQQKGAFIGSVYKKAMYYQYNDSDFRVRRRKADHMGLLGPVIGGEAGDVIKITFRNMASRNFSIKPWGAKDANDPFNSDKEGISPETEKTYEWIVPDNAVPPKGQPGCNSWIYKSNVDETKDPYSGLIGPLLLCRKGSYNGNAGTSGYNKDFYTLFMIFDENKSHYLDQNLRTFAQADPSTFNKKNESFHESNLMHGINGKIYHLPGLDSSRDEEVLWHLIGYGNNVDVHTAHFHAHAFAYVSDVVRFNDVFNLFPGKIGTVHMRTTEPGTWLMHCHVDDHIQAGMVTTFTVADTPKPAQNWNLESWEIAFIILISIVGLALVIGAGWCITECCRGGKRCLARRRESNESEQDLIRSSS